MQRDKAQIESALLKKGFKTKEGDHHHFYYQQLDGTITSVRTKTSHSKQYKAILDPLLGEMARQCHLSKKEFIDLVDCPLSQEKYEETLVKKKAI